MKPIQLDLTRRGALRAIGVAGGALALPALAQLPTVTLRYASLFNKEHSASRSSEYFAELVAKKTDGKVRIQVFHNGALGTEEEAARGVHSGYYRSGLFRSARVWQLHPRHSCAGDAISLCQSG